MTTTSPPLASPHDSWADLSEAKPSAPDLTPADVEADKKPETAAGICPECGEPIVREPGTRGRLPKYHSYCKPATSGASSTRTRRTSHAKAEQEADLCIAQFKSWTVKGCIMVATVDQYDAFALMVGMTEITNNLRGVLIRYEKFRKEWLAAQGGGSLIGLVMSVTLTMLPILAHHGMFGKGPLAHQLVQTPNMLFKIQQQLKDGEANLTKIMADQVQAMNDQKSRKQSAEQTANGYQAAR